MEANSIKRLEIDWEAFRTTVFDEVPYAQRYTQTYPAIRTALQLLADGHSSYRAVTGDVLFVPTRRCESSGAETPALPSAIGYVRVGAYRGGGLAGDDFATDIQSTIAVQDRGDVVGWIVDLRGNTGGNMWPMVAGLGPLLGEGVLGYFLEPTGVAMAWGYEDGQSWLEDVTIQSVQAPYELEVPEPKVAVLIDNLVVSSGEAVAIAFKKRPNTRFFGMATCGLSTANRSFRMSDGAILNLTTSFMADRTQDVYGDQVEPDEVVLDPDLTVERAVEWLEGGM